MEEPHGAEIQTFGEGERRDTAWQVLTSQGGRRGMHGAASYARVGKLPLAPATFWVKEHCWSGAHGNHTQTGSSQGGASPSLLQALVSL